MLLCCWVGLLSAQKPMHLSLEVGGSGGLASVNLEKQYVDRGKFQLHGRLGLSYMPVDQNNGGVIILPVMVHGLLGNKGHFADLGLGQTFSVTTQGSLFFRMPVGIGYRFQPEGRKYYLRASYTPLVSYLLDLQWEHWAGITFGYRIRN